MKLPSNARPARPRHALMRRRLTPACVGVALGLGITFVGSPRAAYAFELQLALGAGGAGSDWRGDGVAFGTIKAGVRGWDVIAPYFLTRLGYGSVDSRLLTMLSVGVQAWMRVGPLRPYVRAGFAHQHEEPVAYLEKNLLGAAFGVGDGIRHRAGADLGVGVDWPVQKWKRMELFLAVEATTTWFTNSSGPSWFWGGSAAFGFNYTL